MPAYELSLLLKNLPKQDLAAALKRVGTLLLDHGVVLQNLQNLGTKNLPYRIKKDEVYHYKGRINGDFEWQTKISHQSYSHRVLICLS
ncbi:28S ribosomal protein S6 like protein [Argiope bruennichi]|uniref:Small ribosomal subunit protein bS6m n=1 Tax=Argiope bruennichi TaxID=94029 RepID=A0A8T0EUF9_ARGBR|nr:28S ribosomal protein S6 like protein [Argiope bruennichi]